MHRADEQQETGWLAPPSELTLGRDEIHVWRASLEQPASVLNQMRAVLNAEEREKAARFVFPLHRERFVVARGILRHLLARYLSKRPAELLFELNAYGKPALRADARGVTRLHFNVSHSGGLALYAFSHDLEVGVDVEQMRQDFATEEIAERFFSPCEVRAFKELPPHQKAEAFFNCWTRKEAYIKALGKGLSHPLESFAVSLAPGLPACLLSDQADPEEAGRWSLLELPIDPGYAAALAIRRHGWTLKRYAWQPPRMA
jgi:4'-phosphopantetheinyl transferase